MIVGAVWRCRHMQSVPAVRICDTQRLLPAAVTIANATFGDARRAGLDIAEPIGGVVDRVDEWIADATFSTEFLFAGSTQRDTCSF